jgi:ribosome biogenesis GTP-binding protein YsxC/EngB
MLAQGVARLSFQKRSWGCKNQNRLSGGRSYTSFERADLDEELLSVRPISGLKPKKSLKRVMPTVEVAQITQKGALKKIKEEDSKTTKKMAEFKKLAVDAKLQSHLDSLKLGRRRLPRQTKEEYGKQRDLSGIGETGEIPSTAYFRPTACRLIAEASTPSYFPSEGIPEVCFAGRSNVGKSSLLNAIAGSPLSKTSPKPGETTTLRWYSNSDLISLVDLPGYGFSFATQNRSALWMETVKTYLLTRKSLRRCFLLVDARQPLKKSDESTIQFLEECKVKYQLVMTKADLVPVPELAKRMQLLQEELKRFPQAMQQILVVSSKNRSGLAAFRRQLIALFDPESKRAFEQERDKKFRGAEKRRAKRADQAEQLKLLELQRQRAHSRKALVNHIKRDRMARKSRESL